MKESQQFTCLFSYSPSPPSVCFSWIYSYLIAFSLAPLYFWPLLPSSSTLFFSFFLSLKNIWPGVHHLCLSILKSGASLEMVLFYLPTPTPIAYLYFFLFSLPLGKFAHSPSTFLNLQFLLL